MVFTPWVPFVLHENSASALMARINTYLPTRLPTSSVECIRLLSSMAGRH